MQNRNNGDSRANGIRKQSRRHEPTPAVLLPGPMRWFDISDVRVATKAMTMAGRAMYSSQPSFVSFLLGNREISYGASRKRSDCIGTRISRCRHDRSQIDPHEARGIITNEQGVSLPVVRTRVRSQCVGVAT